jgi:hypothetical protein
MVAGGLLGQNLLHHHRGWREIPNVGVQFGLRETASREEPTIVGEHEAGAQMQFGEAAPPGLGLGRGDEGAGDPLAALSGRTASRPR